MLIVKKYLSSFFKASWPLQKKLRLIAKADHRPCFPRPKTRRGWESLIMPGVVMFGRRWGIATDDFVFPGGFEIFFRLVWLFVVLSAYFLEDSDSRSFCGDAYRRLEAFLIRSIAGLTHPRTMGQNQVILRHQKFTFPRAREWAKRVSEQTSDRSGARERSG